MRTIIERAAGAGPGPRGSLTPYLFEAPALLLTIVVLLVPMLYALGLSFFQYSLAHPDNTPFVGFRNYHDVLTQSGFLLSVWITVLYTVGAVLLEFVLGLAFALLMNREMRLQGVVRTILLLPLFLTPIVVGLIWTLLYTPGDGVLSQAVAIMGFGQNVGFLGQPATALLAVIIVDVWQATPFIFLILLAGLQSLPSHVFEAAAIDGASSWQTLTWVTLPMLKPLILIALIIRSMDAFRSFDTIYVLTGGGPGVLTQVLSLTVYYLAFQTYDLGLASAASYVVLFLVLIFSGIFIREMRRGQGGV